MFSTCSELTPRAPIPDGRMERFMHPWPQGGQGDQGGDGQGQVQGSCNFKVEVTTTKGMELPGYLKK